ncbi:MAG TPA: DUF2784 domain-containing protein [Burkholderiaceae bacterium]
MPEPGWTALADLVLAVHAAIAASVVLGLFAIVVGNLRGWRWVNDGRFRAAHLAAIAIVAAESWLGIPCPLTTLETSLRARAGGTTYAGGFIEHWVRRALFFDGPAWAFTLAYTAFGLAVLASWWRWPPRRRG